MVSRIFKLMTLLLPLLFSMPARGQDLVGFSAKDTCKNAMDAEIAHGSKLVEPTGRPNSAMEPFYGTVQFQRTHNNAPARIIYLCQGTKASGGSIVAQHIYIERKSQSAARSEFQQQKEWLGRRYGAPCWDPFRLSEAQRALLPAGSEPEKLLQGMTIWKTGLNIYTDISWYPVRNATPEMWHIVVSTHAPTDFSAAGEPFLSMYRLSTCDSSTSRRTSREAK